MQNNFFFVTCFSILLWGYAEAQLSDEECAAYHEIRTAIDYETFVDDCAGKEILGFEHGVSKEFYATELSETMFNKLFMNARSINFHITVENTEFKSLQLPRLENLNGGLTIRNNIQLKSFRIRRGLQLNRKQTGPTTVTVDSNENLNEESMADLRYLCPYCDIFEWSKCSALDSISPEEYDDFVQKCKGEKIIKSRPGKSLVLDLKKISMEQFNLLFAEATHVQMCITMRDVSWTNLVFPKLKRLIPCGRGNRALKAVHNRNLRSISFPAYNSEGFGRLNYMSNIELRNNFVLNEEVYGILKPHCRFCTLQQYRECDSIEEYQTRNATKFVELCGGKKIMKPAGDTILELDISTLNQELVDELFQDVVYIKMCITLRQSQIRYLRMPKLVELYSCETGRVAFTIESNQNLEVIQVSESFKWDICYESFHIVYAPQLSHYPPLHRCKYCVLERNTRCGMLAPSLSYQSLTELLENCSGKQMIVFREVVVVTEEQFTQLCSKALYLQMCFNISDTQYASIKCPMLRSIKPCVKGQQVFTIISNPLLESITIATTVIYPTDERIMNVQNNPQLPQSNIEGLKKICPHCVIQGISSKCSNLSNVGSLNELFKLCTGQPIISVKEEVVLDSSITEKQLNLLFSEVIEVKMCLTIHGTLFKNLIFPKLILWKACEEGKLAIRIINNPFLQSLKFPSCINGGCIESGVVSGNPLFEKIQIEIFRRWCPTCQLKPYVPACGLGDRMYTVQELVRVCAGQEIITPRQRSPIVIESSEVTEEEMNKFCSRAIYIEGCIVISDSSYRSFRCPHLLAIKPCNSGRQVFTITNNFVLETISISTTVIYPTEERIIIVQNNPQVPSSNIGSLKKICPNCVIEGVTSRCNRISHVGNMNELFKLCAGQPIITVTEEVIVDFNFTETQLNSLFSEAIEVNMCIRIRNSAIKSLVFPKLKRWKSCATDKPAFVISNNPYLETLKFPSCEGVYCLESGIVEENPRLSREQIVVIQKWCPNCQLKYYSSGCDLQKRDYSQQQLIDACAGKRIIRPAEGYILVLSSAFTTEENMNALCSRAVYMEICIIIANSQFIQLRCPYLREIKSCIPGWPAITIKNNPIFEILLIPLETVYPKGEFIVQVEGNPRISHGEIEYLKNWCKNCVILPNRSTTKSVSRRCQLEAREYSGKELVQICAGAEIIKPYRGFPLMVSSSEVTEIEMNQLCSNVVYMEICISIINSNFVSLRFPRLRELRPCLPGKPALQIVNNIQFVELFIPTTIRIFQEESIFEISENPHLSIEVIRRLKRICERCTVTANLGCDLESRTYTNNQLVAACAGKKIIRPAKGFILVLSSSTTTEEQMNALCSEAVFMEICIDITKSGYKSLRCPYLKELEPCVPGRPAIRIVNNLEFEILEIPWQFTYPREEKILEIANNPRLPYFIIDRLKILCPTCTITANLGCGLQKRDYSQQEMINTCAGKEIIKPAIGYMLVVNSATTTEQQMNALCSRAVYMEICITISRSQFIQLRCPYLREIRPCMPGRPAIIITNNPVFENLFIPLRTIYPEGELIVELRGNPRIPPIQIQSLKKWCPQCTISSSNYSPKPVRCQLEARAYTGEELVKVCAGAEIIKSYRGFPLIVSSTTVTEEQLNNLCSNAVFMEICISVVNSSFRRLRCPRLREIRPCMPGRPALQIVNNIQMEDLYIPMTIRYPTNELVFEITENPRISITVINWLKVMCERCKITANLGCDLETRTYTNNQLVAACAGKKIIRPAEGFILKLSSSTTTEQQMNALCSEAVFMEICIDIIRSVYRTLRCPHLRELRPCLPGRPAIRIVDNFELEIFELPSQFVFPRGQKIIEISGNPLLEYVVISKLSQLCPACTITANSGCGLAKQGYSVNEMINACAGQRIIRPFEGETFEISSTTVTEEQFNALCSKAVYMEMCMTISGSQYTQIRCPYLRYIRPCRPGVPALRIINNYSLERIVISERLRFNKMMTPLEIRGNRRLELQSLNRLRRLCPYCKITP